MSSADSIQDTAMDEEYILEEYLDEILSPCESSSDSVHFLVQCNSCPYEQNEAELSSFEILNSTQNADQDDSGNIPMDLGLHEPTEDLTAINNNEDEESQIPERTRKRRRQEQNWKRNIIKKLREEGKAYISETNKLMPAKKITSTKDCAKSCSFQCRFIREDERLKIFQSFYLLDASAKRSFLLNSTERDTVTLRRSGKSASNSRKQFSFRYFFYVGVNRFRVCKHFFLGTLSISQQRVYHVHQSKDSVSAMPSKSKQGKHTKNSVPDKIKEAIRNHIMKFPTIESHYCRRDSSKRYLESHLSVVAMHQMFIEEAATPDEKLVKVFTYRNIFNSECNISFFKPKKDRCDLCEEFKVMENSTNTFDQLKNKYENHIVHKNETRHQRQKDRDSSIPVLCFDLQNVLSCPKAEISSFFYHSKLNTYNLTGHLSTNNKVYCALWNESMMGRSGNDLASALIKILEKVFGDNPHFTEIILWADSCVPQNRNSIMSFAIMHFIETHSKVSKITIRFSTPGHSCIQEIDAVHSIIERRLQKREYYSPISLLRILLNVSYKNSRLVIMQMVPTDFKNYQECSKYLNFKSVPFTKVCELKFTQSYSIVGYKSKYNNEIEHVNLRYDKLPRKSCKNNKFISQMPVPKEILRRNKLPESKIKSFKAMLPFMPKIDLDFFQKIIDNSK